MISRSTSSKYGNFYSAWPGGGSVALADTSGALRIARSKGVVRTFFRYRGRWKELGEKAISGEIWVGLTLGAFATDWQQKDVSASFDSFAVTAPNATCPAGSDPRSP
jgi:hypothetical protein